MIASFMDEFWNCIPCSWDSGVWTENHKRVEVAVLLIFWKETSFGFSPVIAKTTCETGKHRPKKEDAHFLKLKQSLKNDGWERILSFLSFCCKGLIFRGKLNVSFILWQKNIFRFHLKFQGCNWGWTGSGLYSRQLLLLGGQPLVSPTPQLFLEVQEKNIQYM